MKTLIKTKLITYKLDISNEKEKEQYENILTDIQRQGTKFNQTLEFQYPHKVSKDCVIEIDFSYIFDNQFNTSDQSDNYPGLRLLDQTECVYSNKRMKKGYYIIVTKAIKAIRDNNFKCGYCGKIEPAQKGYIFCPHCLDSEYLTEDNLYLTKMKAISDNSERKQLSTAELSNLLPAYVKAQTTGKNSRNRIKLEKQRADIISKHKKEIYAAETEKNGFLWLMDNNINIDNCIYYSHNDRFSFGWRQAVSNSVKNKILEVISEFPYRYEIKCNDNNTLENY